MTIETSNYKHDKLLPCPFCGESRTKPEEGQHWIHPFRQWRDGKRSKFFAVACTACGIQQCTIAYESEREAIIAWNTRRPNAAELMENLEILKDFLKAQKIKGTDTIISMAEISIIKARGIA